MANSDVLAGALPAGAALALLPTPPAALALDFQIDAPDAVSAVLAGLRLPPGALLGIGRPLVDRLVGPAALPGLSAMRDRRGPGGHPKVPADQAPLFGLVTGADPGAALHRGRALCAALGPAFSLRAERALYTFAGGRDLSGYADGTENPTGDAALEAAFVAEGPLAGSTFLSAQVWQHALRALEALPQADQDRLIGRRRSDDVELDDAPPRAHVRRTAQESFDPPTFLLRRSMPWGGLGAHGLLFFAYATEVAAFDRMMSRMLGEEDGVVDAIFDFSSVLGGGHYWVPAAGPGGALQLGALGLG
jgi:putative iron-dependent peroxidase